MRTPLLYRTPKDDLAERKHKRRLALEHGLLSPYTFAAGVGAGTLLTGTAMAAALLQLAPAFPLIGLTLGINLVVGCAGSATPRGASFGTGLVFSVPIMMVLLFALVR